MRESNVPELAGEPSSRSLMRLFAERVRRQLVAQRQFVGCAVCSQLAFECEGNPECSPDHVALSARNPRAPRTAHLTFRIVLFVQVSPLTPPAELWSLKCGHQGGEGECAI
jgi:hypothetical protein